MERHLLISILILVISNGYLVHSLECYVCSGQPGNKDKCVKTSKQCYKDEDVCMSHIYWTIPPYWQPMGLRVHMIWKDCATKAACYAAKARDASRCRREWYLDWYCTECCVGDLCNYYVTMGAGSLSVSKLLIALVASLSGLLLLRARQTLWPTRSSSLTRILFSISPALAFHRLSIVLSSIP
jgi:lymphocyte antigen 6 complex protein